MALIAPIRSDQLTRRRIRGRDLVLELVVPVVFIAVWWFASASSVSPYFPPLANIVSSFWRIWISPTFVTDALPSLAHLAAGFAIATVVGVGVGLALGMSRFLSDSVWSLLEFVRAIPGVALVPAAILLLGIGPTTQIVIIASATLWPILLNTIDGVRSMDPVLVDVARSYGIRWSDRFARMVLRSASPQIVAGMNTALAIGLVMILFSEMEGSTNGIGYTLLSAQRSFAVADMWASIVFLGLLGYLLNVAFRGFEALVLRWHRGMRDTSR